MNKKNQFNKLYFILI